MGGHRPLPAFLCLRSLLFCLACLCAVTCPFSYLARLRMRKKKEEVRNSFYKTSVLVCLVFCFSCCVCTRETINEFPSFFISRVGGRDNVLTAWRFLKWGVSNFLRWNICHGFDAASRVFSFGSETVFHCFTMGTTDSCLPFSERGHV